MPLQTLAFDGLTSGVTVVEDKEHGVRCYVYRGYGISCLEIAR
jgi:hypothetical protein